MNFYLINEKEKILLLRFNVVRLNERQATEFKGVMVVIFWPVSLLYNATSQVMILRLAKCCK